MIQIIRMKDAAKMLGIGIATLYRYQETQPGFPSRVKIGPRVSGFKRDELEAWIESGQVASKKLGADQ